MIRIDTPIAFIDTETLGLDPAAPVWEFAGVRIDPDGTEACREEFLIEHDPCGWLDTLPEQFAADYRARYRDEHSVSTTLGAARRIHRITDGAVIAGSNPSFDMQRLDLLLRGNGVVPGWHYHPLDIPSMALGFVARARQDDPPHPTTWEWKSDALSSSIGVDSRRYTRHTAMGDVQWCLAQWRAMTGQTARDE